MDRDAYLRKLHFRAQHRGTREADAIVGGYFDQHHANWSESEFAWFEEFMEEQDADIIGWATRTIAVPAQWQGPLMAALQQLDFVQLPAGLGNAD